MVSSPTLARTCFDCSGVSEVAWAWPESAVSVDPLSQDLHPEAPTRTSAADAMDANSDEPAFTAAKPTTACAPLHASRPATKDAPHARRAPRRLRPPLRS